MKVDLLPQHEALLDVVGDEVLVAGEIVARARKAGRAELDGYYSPMAVQVHLDQLVAWGLLAVAGERYLRTSL